MGKRDSAFVSHLAALSLRLRPTTQAGSPISCMGVWEVTIERFARSLLARRTHYKHPLPQHVYDVYMQYWADVRFALTEC